MLDTVKLPRSGRFGHDPHKVYDAIRRLAQDNARNRVVNDVAEVTDNTAGTPDAAFVIPKVTLPASHSVSASDGASATNFNTQFGKIEDNAAALSDYLNDARSLLGLPILTWQSGTFTTNTLAAMGAAVTGATGANSAELADAQAEINNQLLNLATLTLAVNELAEGTGDDNYVVNNNEKAADENYVIWARTDVGTDSDGGTTAVSKADVDAVLVIFRDAYATLADKINDIVGTLPDDLTDNSGGTANADTVAAVDTAFALHQDGGVDSAPKAGWDTEMPKLENNFADLVARVNILATHNGLDLLTDNSTGTADTTLEVIDDTLTPVDGTGSNALDNVTANNLVDIIANNVATVVAKVNELVPHYGVAPLTDDSGGTAGADVAEIGASGAGVDNGASALGVANADANAFLDSVTDAFATIAAKLNEMTSAETRARPLRLAAIF